MIRSLAVLTSVLLFAPLSAWSDDAQMAQEVRELKQLVEQQMKRLDELTVQVGRLVQAVEAQKAAALPGTPLKLEAASPPPAFSGLSELKPLPGTPPAANTDAVEAPKAEAVGVKHTVAKGETLTSIAKHYNVPLADLQKANKDVNDRKLQIGQILTIPTAKAADPTSSERKENP
jgi:LysM repeat protein